MKQDFRRAVEGRKLYENRCSEEILSSQIYHKEIARYGKGSKEADKVRKEIILLKCD